MIIYQVVDEQNNLVSEHLQRDIALQSAEDWTVWYEDHYYHVEEVTSQESEEPISKLSQS
jgi:hypothetical protein